MISAGAFADIFREIIPEVSLGAFPAVSRSDPLFFHPFSLDYF